MKADFKDAQFTEKEELFCVYLVICSPKSLRIDSLKTAVKREPAAELIMMWMLYVFALKLVVCTVESICPLDCPILTTRVFAAGQDVLLKTTLPYPTPNIVSKFPPLF